MTRQFCLYLLLAAALFMRAVLPQGYMPERSEHGSIAVVICGSGAVHRIPVGDESEQDQEPRAQAPCAFTGLAAPAVPAPTLPVLLLPARTVLACADGERVIVRAAAPHLHPPARGPPLTA